MPFNAIFLSLVQTSDTHSRMIETLVKLEFVTQEFILSPLQFGVPYSRPRYFCLVIYALFLLPSHSDNLATFHALSYFAVYLIY